MPQTAFTQSITFLSTTDLAATGAFYENLLGLELAIDQGDCRIYRVGRESFLGFCQRPGAPETKSVIFTLVSDDVDGWAGRLAAAGVSFEKAPTLNEKYRIYNCFFRDPNGYLLEIQRFLDPDWDLSA